jgi:NCAIR mutase (PurE)-related protein
MMNSCGSGVTVVNIDNGFGAGYAASQINELAAASGGFRSKPSKLQ